MYFCKIVATVLAAASFIPVLLAQSTSSSEIIFPLFVEVRAPNRDPQFIEIDTLRMEYEVVNPNPSVAHVTFQRFDSSGKELPSFVGLAGPVDVPAKGVGRLSSFVFGASTARNEVGWIRLTATQPVIVREEFVHSTYIAIGLSPPFEAIKAKFEKFPSQAVRHGLIKVHSDPAVCLDSWADHVTTNTILAVAFPSSNPSVSAKGTFILRNEKGEFIDQKDVSIPANGLLVSSFDALFVKPTNPPIPPPLPQITGTLEFVFDSDVYFAAFQMTTGLSLTKGAIELVEEPNGGIAR